MTRGGTARYSSTLIHVHDCGILTSLKWLTFCCCACRRHEEISIGSARRGEEKVGGGMEREREREQEK